ncbi:hypothetical protein BpHYR1_017643 [Brachionus plicatilis]|uniref:Uncharacterized protein n=1 Tax=Brachionus plicatilis TaxID=10195 RepID=A0A3M7RFX4_BRAPC|nr:hypothetical protein BpHYR1_017643 [Brachionus plicatilis]
MYNKLHFAISWIKLAKIVRHILASTLKIINLVREAKRWIYLIHKDFIDKYFFGIIIKGHYWKYHWIVFFIKPIEFLISFAFNEQYKDWLNSDKIMWMI